MNITQMKYSSVISAMPALRKRLIKNMSKYNKVNVTRLNNEPHIKINNTLKQNKKNAITSISIEHF